MIIDKETPAFTVSSSGFLQMIYTSSLSLRVHLVYNLQTRIFYCYYESKRSDKNGFQLTFEFVNLPQTRIRAGFSEFNEYFISLATLLVILMQQQTPQRAFLIGNMKYPQFLQISCLKKLNHRFIYIVPMT